MKMYRSRWRFRSSGGSLELTAIDCPPLTQNLGLSSCLYRGEEAVFQLPRDGSTIRECLTFHFNFPSQRKFVKWLNYGNLCSTTGAETMPRKFCAGNRMRKTKTACLESEAIFGHLLDFCPLLFRSGKLEWIFHRNSPGHIGNSRTFVWIARLFLNICLWVSK